jgi:hypothetical protein
MRRYAIVGTAILLLVPFGCKKDASDQNLVEIAVVQEKQQREMLSLSGKIERLEETLVGIQQSLEKPHAAVGVPASAAGKEGSPPDFRDTEEYAQIVALLSDVQTRLDSTQSGLSQTQQNLAREEQLEQLRDVGQAFGALGNPQEMDRRLTLLVQNFAPKIEDAVKRQQFEVDVQQLKESLAAPATVEELYQRRTEELTARLNEEQDERRRQSIERQLTSLQTATAEQLQQRLDWYQRSETMRQVGRLQQEYDIPRQTLRDSGIPTLGTGLRRLAGRAGRGR